MAFRPEENQSFRKAAGANAQLTRHDDHNTLAGQWSHRNERCRVCNALGGCCSCSKAHPDKARIKDALSNVALNTPFARAKLLKTYEGVGQQEEAHRKQVRAEQVEAFRRIEELQRRSLALMSCVEEEATAREAFHAHVKGRIDTMLLQCASGCRIVTHERHEAAERATVVNEWQRGCQRMHETLVEHLNVDRLFAAEADERFVLISDAAVGFGDISVAESSARARMALHAQQRRALAEECTASHAQLRQDFFDGFERILAVLHGGIREIDAWQRDRTELWHYAQHVMHATAAEEVTARGDLHQTMIARWDALTAMLSAHDEERAEACRSEALARAELADVESHVREDVWYRMVEHYDAAVAITAAKTAAREHVAIEAQHCASTIAAAEFAAREELFVLMLAEAEQRAAWIVEKQHALAAFVDSAWQMLHDITVAELHERTALFDAMRDAEAHLEHALQQHAYDLQCLEYAEQQDRAHGEKEQLEVVSALWERMYDESVAVQQWIEAKAQARADAVATVLAVRHDVASDESAARDALWQALCAGAETVQRALDDQAECRAAALRAAFAGAEAVAFDEALAFDDVRAAFASELHTAWLRQCNREQFAMDAEHMHGVHRITHDEACERHVFESFVHDALTAQSANAALLFTGAVDALTSSELRTRNAIQSDEQQTFYALSEAGQVSHDDAAQRQAQREHQEMLAQQHQMTEAPRDYNPDEEPCVLGGGAATHSVVGEASDEAGMQREYLADALGVDVSTIDAATAFTLVAFVDALANKVTAATEKRGAIERRVEALDKKMARAREAETASQQQVTFYEDKLAKEQATFQRSMTAVKADVKQAQRELRIAEAKHAQSESDRNEAHEAFEVLKEEIHEAYRRRR